MMGNEKRIHVVPILYNAGYLQKDDDKKNSIKK